MGYPSDILSSRAVVKPGLFAVIPENGLVNNVIPVLKGCRTSILASPKMGAGFVEYVIEVEPSGGTVSPMASEKGVECFLYCISGNITANGVRLESGGFVYSPPDSGMTFENCGTEKAKIIFYKQKYIPFGDKKPYQVTGNINETEYRIYDDMENVFIKDFLPTDDLSFDMNMHILAFAPGGCHPFVETHVQEHGAYILTGEGMYLMEDKWMPIKKNDFMWFGAFVQQGAYGVGREMFSYIYSKDCNRDAVL